MSNTATHSAILAARSYGEQHAAAITARGEAAKVTDGWASAKLSCAINFAAAVAKDASVLDLAAEVADAFTVGSTGKALAANSKESQGRKFKAIGALAGNAPDWLANIQRVVADLGAVANNSEASQEDRASAKRATVRAFEKARSLASLAVKSGNHLLSTGDIKAVLCEGDAPSAAKKLSAAIAALEAAMKLDPECGVADYMEELRSIASTAKATEDAARAKAKADEMALAASEAAAERAARAASKAAEVKVEDLITTA